MALWEESRVILANTTQNTFLEIKAQKDKEKQVSKYQWKQINNKTHIRLLVKTQARPSYEGI